MSIRGLMATLFIGLIVSIFIGCTGKSNVGDGKIDAVEEAEIRVAVGLVLSAKPELVPVAALVTSKLLDVMSDDYLSALSIVDIVIASETETLKLTPEEKISFNDLVVLVKAKILSQVGEGTGDNSRLVMVKQVIRIVNESANARLLK